MIAHYKVISSDSELWGWEEFSQINYELSQINYELCTIEYASYAVERLELAVSGVARLKNLLETNRLAVRIQDRHVVDSYVSDIEELLIFLRALSQKWHTHEETIEQRLNR